MDTKKIGSFISELRKEKGLNQKELAQMLSVTDKAISKWETGRGLPDISIIQSLANSLDVSVTEILNGERMPKENHIDEKLIRKLKIKKYFRWMFEFAITVAFAWFLYLLFSTYMDYGNVLDIFLHRKEIYFISNSTLIFAAVFIIWILTVIISAVKKKKAAVFKTIIICLAASFLIGAALYMAHLDDSRHYEFYEEPVDMVRYANYENYFNDEYSTLIIMKDTNDIITENYAVQLQGNLPDYNRVETTCVTANDYDVVKAYYNQQKGYFTDYKSSDINSDMLKNLEIRDGCYFIDEYGMTFYFIKNTSCYEVYIDKINTFDDTLAKKIIKEF